MLSYLLCNCSQECIWFACIVVHRLGLVLPDKSDIVFESLTLLIAKLKVVIQHPVGFFLFACLLFKLPQLKQCTTACVIRCKYPGCWTHAENAGAGLTVFVVYSTDVLFPAQKFLSWVFIYLKFKGYLKLFIWHPTILLDPSRCSKCTRTCKAERCPLCLSELIKGTLCSSHLNFYILLISRGTSKPLYYGLAPKVPIHLSLIKIVCSFFETDSCGSQLFCMTSNQLQYCKRRYKKLQSQYHTIGSQFSLV